MPVSPMRLIVLGAAALTLCACGQSVDQAAAPPTPAPEAAPTASADSAATAGADAAATASATPSAAVPASSAVTTGPGTGPEAYNSPAPMSNPTSPTGKNNPPSDVLGR